MFLNIIFDGQVRVQSDPAGRLIISGEPEQLDNPWGVTPFKKVSLFCFEICSFVSFHFLLVSLCKLGLFALGDYIAFTHRPASNISSGHSSRSVVCPSPF